MDSLLQFKRDLWAMKQIVASKSYGISAKTLSDKWKDSYLNDTQDGITTRTFFRMRDRLESMFGVEIECIGKGSGEPRYRIDQKNVGPDADDLSLMELANLKLAQDASKNTSMLVNILGLLTSGANIEKSASDALSDIVDHILHLPIEYERKLRAAVDSGELAGADRTCRDEYYRNYIDIWNDADYRRNKLWLAIGIDRTRMLFYIVTEDQNPEVHSRIAQELNLKEGIQYAGDYWWFEPADESLFRLDVNGNPDDSEVRSRIEMFIKKISDFK